MSLAKYSKKMGKISYLTNTSVIVDKKGFPLGFVFGRDAFISFLTAIDEEFEKKVTNPKQAFTNPAGKLIDLIEENLRVNPEFVKDLKTSLKKTKKEDWIPLTEIKRVLNV